MAAIHLVRHGQASFGATNYDVLSELGREQGRILGSFVRRGGFRVDAIVCGPAVRHRETAESFVEGHGESMPWRIDPGFAEFDHLEVLDRYRPGFGDMAVLAAELAAQPDPRRAFEGVFRASVARWTDPKHAADYTEPYAAFVGRCERAFADVCNAADDRTHIWVFTSGGPISAIVRGVLGVNETTTWELNASIVNASITTLRSRGTRARLETFNSHAHLRIDDTGRLITWR